MASLERLAGEGPKKKRKRVSAKFRRLTKERRQANARERDRANALRAAFMSLESSLPQVLKEQLPTRFGTMLAAILYIGHLSELVCDGESPSLEVANRVVCRRYQGLAGEEEIEDGDDVQNTGDDGQQVELKLAGNLLLTSSSLASSIHPRSVKCSSISSSPSCDSASSSDTSSDQGISVSNSSPSPSPSLSTMCSLEDIDLGYNTMDLMNSSLFAIPDLGGDDIFAGIF